jgi:hypothetical protein
MTDTTCIMHTFLRIASLLHITSHHSPPHPPQQSKAGAGAPPRVTHGCGPATRRRPRWESTETDSVRGTSATVHWGWARKAPLQFPICPLPLQRQFGSFPFPRARVRHHSCARSWAASHISVWSYTRRRSRIG